MKKNYVAPEMEELKIDEPVVLQDVTISTEKDKACTGESVDDI